MLPGIPTDCDFFKPSFLLGASIEALLVFKGDLEGFCLVFLDLIVQISVFVFNVIYYYD